ncbi:MAG: alpha/beta hydrolase-fold protein [Isosphaeraceae bacterium]
MVLSCILAAVLLPADPITPSQLADSLIVPPRGESARKLEQRIRQNFPKDKDLKEGKHWIEGPTVAFVIEVAKDAKPRLGGMLDHGRGLDLVPIGDSGLWARTESIPTEAKFSYHFEVDKKKIGAKTVEMPDWAEAPEASQVKGRKYGQYRPFKMRSEVFQNGHTGWIYIPAAYREDGPPAALMVFQDGDAYKDQKVGNIVDNLIAEGAMPVTILVLINPGLNDDGTSNRSLEYDSLGDAYARFLEKEVLPGLAKEYRLKDAPTHRAIGGASSGGIAAFNAAWERPELFGKVCSHIGSFTNIRGGDALPKIIREADSKPIKVLLYDGTNDLINEHGDWWHANEQMHAALSERGYEVQFLKDRNFHAYWSSGKQLPASLRWLWSDLATTRTGVAEREKAAAR